MVGDMGLSSRRTFNVTFTSPSINFEDFGLNFGSCEKNISSKVGSPLHSATTGAQTIPLLQ